MYVIDPLIEKINNSVEKHYLGNGEYSRFNWQNEQGTRKMGLNEYGCADAFNIHYTTNSLPTGEKKQQCLNVLLNLQEKDTGLFREKEPIHCIHTTAHCIAALDLIDEKPKYQPTAMFKYFTKEGIRDLLDSLQWGIDPWSQAHIGAGVYVVGVLTDNVNLDWQNYYFDMLYENTDPKYGMSRKGMIDGGVAPVFHHLNGWFHYLFNMQYAKRPLRYPETLIDTLIDLYKTNNLSKTFGRDVTFAEIDWVYTLNRASRQTAYRFNDIKECLRDFAKRYLDYFNSVDFETDDNVNDIHMLFGATCCLAELQSALIGEIISTRPLRLVLDRRPFI